MKEINEYQIQSYRRCNALFIRLLDLSESRSKFFTIYKNYPISSNEANDA